MGNAHYPNAYIRRNPTDYHIRCIVDFAWIDCHRNVWCVHCCIFTWDNFMWISSNTVECQLRTIHPIWNSVLRLAIIIGKMIEITPPPPHPSLSLYSSEEAFAVRLMHFIAYIANSNRLSYVRVHFIRILYTYDPRYWYPPFTAAVAATTQNHFQSIYPISWLWSERGGKRRFVKLVFNLRKRMLMLRRATRNVRMLVVHGIGCPAHTIETCITLIPIKC